MAADNRVSFSINALLYLTALGAIAFGVLRFMVRNPEMLPPLMTLGFFLSLLVGPSLVSKFKESSHRVAVGCCLLPTAYIVLWIGVAMLVAWLQD